MPITPQPTHQAGDYPDTVRHISDGDPANQTFMRNPSFDLEFRTDVLKDTSNSLETTVASNFNTLDAFDKNHDHGGGSGEKVLDFSQIYGNDTAANAGFDLATAGQYYIKKSGGGADLLRVVEDGALPKDQVIFPGSVDLHEHMAAPASDLVINPHDLKLSGRMFPISLGALIDGATNGPYTEVVLDPAATVGLQFAAPGLLSKTSSDGVTSEGVLVGNLTTPMAHKDNIVLIHLASTNEPVLDGTDPVYGLLRDTNPGGAPVWEISFFSDGTPYSFTTDVLVTLYGNEAYALSNVTVVDSKFVNLCQTGVNT